MLLEQPNPCFSCGTSVSTFIVCNTFSPHNTGISVKLKLCPNASYLIHLSDWKLIQWNVHYLRPTSVDIFCALCIRFYAQRTQSSHLAQQAHLLLCIASWACGSDLHTSQWKHENHHACWENRKKGGHKLNGSTPCCVTQQILPLTVSNAYITNAEA